MHQLSAQTCFPVKSKNEAGETGLFCSYIHVQKKRVRTDVSISQNIFHMYVHYDNYIL